jgi:hypothetical protein
MLVNKDDDDDDEFAVKGFVNSLTTTSVIGEKDLVESLERIK